MWVRPQPGTSTLWGEAGRGQTWEGLGRGPVSLPSLEALRVGSSAAERGMLFIFFWLGGPGSSSSFPVREGLLNSEFNLSSRWGGVGAEKQNPQKQSLFALTGGALEG